MSKRVLVAGLFHETHTFLESDIPLSSFQQRLGDEMFEARGDGSPLAGFLKVADECDWAVTPIIDLRATPGGIVDDEVFDHFWANFESVGGPLLSRNEVDGIYLVLHGAMVTRSLLDVEGELVGRIRQLPGAESIPVCGILDLHGNISRRTIEQTQGMIAYRNNPHTDACETAERAARLLDRILTTKQQPVSIWAQPPIMWPPTGTGTADDPMRTLEAMAREIEATHEEIAAVNVMGGFSFADTPDTGVSFAAVTFGEAEIARQELQRLVDWSIDHQSDGNKVDRPLADCRNEIRADVEAGRTPVIVVEPADNIGGGAPGDTTELLQFLLGEQFSKSACVINDPVTVSQLVVHSVGELVKVSIGARESSSFCQPVELEVELVSVSDGKFDLEDPNSHLASMCGVHIDMGPCAVVRNGGVSILLTTRKTPPFDLGQLRSQGIIPEECSVIGVKAAVAHRRAYDPVTATTYTVDTAGPCSSNIADFPWQHVRRPVYPLP
ncbi:MAG: M81 family metallopeptidase [Planctomycetaceae bacterium]|nr:M81 family metallopeptidase [Planctomycetaceae bacterium]